MYFNKALFSENSEPLEIELICDKCGKIINVKEMNIFDKVRSEYCIINENQNIECECGNKSGSGILEPKKGTMLPKHNTSYSTINVPKCPTCGSTNLRKISTTSKATNTIAFGLFGAKRNKTFHCNNCGYEW